MGLPTNLQNESVPEIETLLGHPSIADLDFEGVEMAVREPDIEYFVKLDKRRDFRRL
jgi:hypothetical protein